MASLALMEASCEVKKLGLDKVDEHSYGVVMGLRGRFAMETQGGNQSNVPQDVVSTCMACIQHNTNPIIILVIQPAQKWQSRSCPYSSSSSPSLSYWNSFGTGASSPSSSSSTAVKTPAAAAAPAGVSSAPAVVPR